MFVEGIFCGDLLLDILYIYLYTYVCMPTAFDFPIHHRLKAKVENVGPFPLGFGSSLHTFFVYIYLGRSSVRHAFICLACLFAQETHYANLPQSYT